MTIKELIEDLKQFGNDKCEVLLWDDNNAKIIGVNTFPDEEDADGPVYIITDRNDRITEMTTRLLLLNSNKEQDIYLSMWKSGITVDMVRKCAGNGIADKMSKAIENHIYGGK